MKIVAICFNDPLGHKVIPETTVTRLMPGICSETYEECPVTILLDNGKELRHELDPVPCEQWWTDEPGCPYLTALKGCAVPYNTEELRERWQQSTNVSRHRGTIGKREDFLLTYDTSFGPFESEYGVSYRHEFFDKKDRFIWWTDKQLDIIPSEQRTIRATVKAHDKFGGIETTVLTRCAPLKGERKLTKDAKDTQYTI